MQPRQRIRLGDYLRIKHGFAFKGQFFASSGKYIVLTPGNFCEGGGIKSQGDREKFYSSDPHPDFVLGRGDLLVVMTDLTQVAKILGAPAFIPEGGLYLHNQRLGKVVGIKPGLDVKYLYYLFNSREVRNQIKATATGTTVRHTAPERIHSIEVDLPSLREQGQIVSILSSYDDLIENNTRRTAILEEMTRRLFDEWFVKFRYPRSAECASDEQLPKGWRRVSIKEVYEGLFDGPHATPAPCEDGPLFLGIGNITEGGRLDLSSVRHISEQDFPKWTKRVTPQEGDIVFTYEATLNRYALIPPGFRGCLGRRLALIRVAPERRYNLFLYYYFFSSEWRQVIAANILSGATVDRIPLTTFPEFPINLPPDELVQRFDAVVRPMVRKVQVLSRQNEILRAARDLLLPKLISGEINVGDAPLPGELAAE